MIPSKLRLLPLVLLAACLAGENTVMAQYVVSWGVCPGVSGFSTGVVAIAGQTLSNVSMIAAGDHYGLALRKDGKLVGWGADQYGQATGPAVVSSERTNGIAILARQAATNIMALSAGNGFSLALRRDGKVLGWGHTFEFIDQRGNYSPPRVVPACLTNVVAIASKYDHGLALRKDATVAVCWGIAEPPIGLSNIVAIAASEEGYNDLALTRDGMVMEWASRYNGVVKQCQGLSNVVAVAAGGGGPSQCYALKHDGTVATWNSYSEFATNIPGFENVAAIAAGGAGGEAYSSYCLALKQDGTLTIHSVANYQPIPVTVPEGLSNVVAIAAGPCYWLAVTTNWAVAEKFVRK